MKKISQFLINCSLLAVTPMAAQAAGTYYTGAYQSPQQRYSTQGYPQQQGYNPNAAGYARPNAVNQNAAQQGYSRYGQTQQSAQTAPQQKKTATAARGAAKKGFYLDGGISHESAMWQFDMNKSGSSLHYDNISWNVFDVQAGYNFSAGKTAMQIDAGLKLGMQSGDSKMVDDDITNGGYFITEWIDSATGATIGEQIGHALSIGTSTGGSMLGFNIGFGLTDFMTWGKTKITPSIGYRHFSYKLKTEQNFGLSVDTSACFKVEGTDEIQCDPAIIVHYADGSKQIIWRDSADQDMGLGNGADGIDTGGTYFYQQPGTSHSYEVAWSGPYVAMDFDYIINSYNSVNGRVEVGLPGYTATGDQPYRFDWQHPKSVEDKAGIGSAIHFGLGANWKTALTERIMLSVGLTYDYYSVSDVDAETFLNETYYTGIYNTLLNQWKTNGKTEEDMLNPKTGDPIARNIKDLESSCPGWVCKSDGEIDSFYKSMGIRVGLNALF